MIRSTAFVVSNGYPGDMNVALKESAASAYHIQYIFTELFSVICVPTPVCRLYEGRNLALFVDCSQNNVGS